jgi:hypothetical protein
MEHPEAILDKLENFLFYRRGRRDRRGEELVLCVLSGLCGEILLFRHEDS